MFFFLMKMTNLSTRVHTLHQSWACLGVGLIISGLRSQRILSKPFGRHWRCLLDAQCIIVQKYLQTWFFFAQVLVLSASSHTTK